MAKSVKKEIMAQIKTRRIIMKDRWIFVAKSIGLKSGLALTFLALIFLVNAFFYYIKTNNLLLPLHSGQSVWQKFLHSLPYDLILVIIILLVILNYIIKKLDISYKKPFVAVFAGSIIFIIFWAILLFSSNFNHQLKGHLERSGINIPFVSDFYIERCCPLDNCSLYDKLKSK